MRARSILFIVLAIGLALVMASFERSRIEAVRREAAATAGQGPASTQTYLLVAAKNLPAGTLLRPGDLQWQSWPGDDINDAYLRKGRDDMASFEGAVVHLQLTKGQPITIGGIIKPGERGFLAAVLAAGTRAATIPLSNTSDGAGLVLPGDHVDLILSHQIRDPDDKNAPARTVSETILTDLRVVAIDQSIDDQDKKPLGGKTATFQVTPKQAEMIEVAKMLGTLTVVLRSAGDKDPVSPSADAGAVTHTWDSDVSPMMRPEKPHAVGAPPDAQITILRGVMTVASATAAPSAPQGGGGAGFDPTNSAGVSNVVKGVGGMQAVGQMFGATR